MSRERIEFSGELEVGDVTTYMGIPIVFDQPQTLVVSKNRELQLIGILAAQGWHNHQS